MLKENQAEQISEKAIILLIAAIQFVNILDFMMVMPLGPDFAKSLGISMDHLGIIGGSYTAAAAVSGFLGAFFLDKFDRKKALLVVMFLLALATALGGFAVGLNSLLAARILAGIFGGPATSLSMSIISDVIAPQHRGKAMGTVMASFSLASVLGVPLGLELARMGGWRIPFFGVAFCALIVMAIAFRLLPSMKKHIALEKPKTSDLFFIMKRPPVLISFAMMFFLMAGNFILIPNLSAYLQFNAHFPREKLGMLYMIGGIGSFFIMHITGKIVDRFGSVIVNFVASSFLITVVYYGYAFETPQIPIIIMFAGFMWSASIRMVAIQSQSSKIPKPHERARFQSMQSGIQHIASALGAFVSTILLHADTSGFLHGMNQVSTIAISAMATVPFFALLLEKYIKKQSH